LFPAIERQERECRAGAAAQGAALLAVLLLQALPGCRREEKGNPRPAKLNAPPPPDCKSDGKPKTARMVAEEVAKVMLEKSKLIESADGLEHWDTPRGRFWVIKNNFDTMAHVLGEQAAEIYGDATRGVRAGDIVLDCGAHFGGFTKVAIERGAKQVVAIEITPESLECLRRNFKAEIAAGKVIVYGKGVWHSEGLMKLERSGKSWSDRVGTTGESSVQLTTIDKIVAELGLPRVDFIKMDIEGSERNALAGAGETLKRFRPRMALASYHLPDDPGLLSQIGRDLQPAYHVCAAGTTLGWGYKTLFFE
jgi:FkbM family methyltransferase